MKTRGKSAWLNSIPVAIGYFRHDSQGYRPLFINDNLKSLFGKTGEELCLIYDDGLTGVFHEDDAPRVARMLYRASITGGTYRELARVWSIDDGCKYMYLWLNSVPQEDGSRLICMAFSDASAEVEKQNRLEKAYESLLRAMDNAPGGIAVLDTVNGEKPTPVYLSHGLGVLLEGDRADVERVYVSDPYRCIHPDDRERVVQAFELAVRSSSEFKVKTRLRTLKDRFVWVWVSGAVNTTGNHRSVYLSLINASIEQELQRTLSRILENFARRRFDHIYIVNVKDGTFYEFGTDGQGLSPIGSARGEDFDQATGDLINNQVIESERAKLAGEVNLASIVAKLKTQNDVEIRYTIQEQDGSLKYKTAWFSWVDEENGSLSLIESDRTDERRRDEESRRILSDALASAEQANAAKSDFLSRMSHDIRTPLNAIIGYTEIGLEDAQIDAAERDRLTKIDSSSRFLLSLINDILDMSRIESGKFALDVEPFDIEDFTAGVSAIIASQCEAEGVRYECTVDSLAYGSYQGDALKLQRIFLNLLGNSVKFTQPGGMVSFTITAKYGRDNLRVLSFRVEDTGCGIAEEFIPHLFETFTQETRNRFNLHKGSGLGLAICKSLVSMMNGTIDVESEVGKGSVFTVEIPFEQVEGEQARKLAEGGTLPGTEQLPNVYDFCGKRVLLAEDNEMNREIACHLLSKVNMAVDCEENGRLGLQRFASQPAGTYAAVITDIIMPEMGGHEMAKAIRALERDDAASIPIIAMSANAFDEDARESMLYGINAYVVKPIDPQILYRTLYRMIER